MTEKYSKFSYIISNLLSLTFSPTGKVIAEILVNKQKFNTDYAEWNLLNPIYVVCKTICIYRQSNLIKSV